MGRFVRCHWIVLKSEFEGSACNHKQKRIINQMWSLFLKAEMKSDPSQSSHTSGSEVLILHFFQSTVLLTANMWTVCQKRQISINMNRLSSIILHLRVGDLQRWDDGTGFQSWFSCVAASGSSAGKLKETYGWCWSVLWLCLSCCFSIEQYILMIHIISLKGRRESAELRVTLVCDWAVVVCSIGNFGIDLIPSNTGSVLLIPIQICF